MTYMLLALLFLASIARINTLFCISRCATTINTTIATCSAPTVCVALNSYFLTNSALQTAYTSLEMSLPSALTSANGFITSQTFALESCTAYEYINISTINATYLYSFRGRMVSTDYIAKQYSVVNPHHRIIIRFTIMFVGTWSDDDLLNLYVNDGIYDQNFSIRYNCRSSTYNYTEMICNRTGSRTDCIRDFEFSFVHNNTALLINFTSLTQQKDSNIMFWNVFDLNVFTVNCNSPCNSCVLDLPSKCTSCIVGTYLNQNSACVSPCILPRQYAITQDALLGGLCVVSCPQGYYATTTPIKSCLKCIAGCLKCTNATDCVLLASYTETYTLWDTYIVIWIILGFLLLLFIVALIRKACLGKKTAVETQETLHIASQVNQNNFFHFKIEQTKDNIPQMDINEHIYQIDLEDHGNMKRKKKRPERNINPS